MNYLRSTQIANNRRSKKQLAEEVAKLTAFAILGLMLGIVLVAVAG